MTTQWTTSAAKSTPSSCTRNSPRKCTHWNEKIHNISKPHRLWINTGPLASKNLVGPGMTVTRNVPKRLRHFTASVAIHHGWGGGGVMHLWGGGQHICGGVTTSQRGVTSMGGGKSQREGWLICGGVTYDRGYHRDQNRGGSKITKGLIKPETIRAPILLHAFFKGSEVP